MGRTVREHLARYSGTTVDFFPNPGNAGDAVIAKATFDLFSELNIKACIHNLSSSPCREVGIFGGGGNLVSGLYNDMQIALAKTLMLREATLLPHTIVEVKEVVEKSLENLFVFAREFRTYEALVQEGANPLNVSLDHDMAFGLKIPKPTKVDSGGISWFLREDVESGLGIELPADNTDLSAVAFGAWGDHEECKQVTQLLINRLGVSGTVITDRLHVGIVSSLLGKQTLLLSNSYYKNEAVFLYSMSGVFPNTSFLKLRPKIKRSLWGRKNLLAQIEEIALEHGQSWRGIG